eukprot:851019-Pelagomonas_calceolata.AAC.1
MLHIELRPPSTHQRSSHPSPAFPCTKCLLRSSKPEYPQGRPRGLPFNPLPPQRRKPVSAAAANDGFAGEDSNNTSAQSPQEKASCCHTSIAWTEAMPGHLHQA